MSEENKAIVRYFYDALWNSVDAAAVDELMDAECDGDICHLRPGGLLLSAEEAFSGANSASYADSVLARFEYMTKTHPELANSIMKRLIIRHEGNFRGIIKSSAKKYKEAIPDVRCTIEEMIAQERHGLDAMDASRQVSLCLLYFWRLFGRGASCRDWSEYLQDCRRKDSGLPILCTFGSMVRIGSRYHPTALTIEARCHL